MNIDFQQDISLLNQEQKTIRQRILDWAGPSFPLEIRDEAARVYADLIKNRISEEVDFYSSELTFGTGGLRGVIGNGSGRMNRWTVGKATLGFCHYLLLIEQKPSIVIAFDSRRMSREFARTSAGIAASLGIKVFLFSDVTPTPILSYAIRHLNASGGVVITASHNPPEYNGYKVYMNDGSQLVGEGQKLVEQAIAEIQDWASIPFLPENAPAYSEHVKMIGPAIRDAYYDEFKSVLFVPRKPHERTSSLKIVYSPLHGTGGGWLPGLLQRYGFSVHLVESQALPDGEFPTVKYPNPEEPEALHKAEETARDVGAPLFLATDPDADRLGAGVLDGGGNYVLLNGNQIGSIMCAYMAEKARSTDPSIRWNLVKTIVTTDLQKEIAEKNGIRIHDVLTGFKYIAEQMKEMEEGAGHYEASKDQFLFGGEESFGYLPVEFVRDKDSLSSALLLCIILAEKGDLLRYLDEIYLHYGLYLELLKSVTLKGSSGQSRIAETMERLRSESLMDWSLGDRRVLAVLDYKNQTRNGKASPADFSGLPSADVVQLFLEGEGKLTRRPSGTEPKVKLYASLKCRENPESPEELQHKKAQLQKELVSITGLFFAKTGLSG